MLRVGPLPLCRSPPNGSDDTSEARRRRDLLPLPVLLLPTGSEVGTVSTGEDAWSCRGGA